jgi:hypothetical protein
MDTSEATLLRAAEVGLDLDWAARQFLPSTRRAEYMSQHAPLRAEYDRQHALLVAEYERQCALLWDDHVRQRAPLWAKYECQRAPLLAVIVKDLP